MSKNKIISGVAKIKGNFMKHSPLYSREVLLVSMQSVSLYHPFRKINGYNSVCLPPLLRCVVYSISFIFRFSFSYRPPSLLFGSDRKETRHFCFFLLLLFLFGTES